MQHVHPCNWMSLSTSPEFNFGIYQVQKQHNFPPPLKRAEPELNVSTP